MPACDEIVTIGIHDFGLFLASAVLLNLTPGQDTLYILGRTLAQGRRIGIAAALGVSAGTAIHCLGAALGLSAIFAASATAFTVMKLAGAAYLVYLGVQLLVSAASTQIRTSIAGHGSWAALRQGVLTNVANPKVALFFLAFLPQFVEPTSTHRLLALLLLGSTFVATSTTWCLMLALGAGRIRRSLGTNQAVGRMLHRAAGLLFIVLGVKLALSER